MEQTTESVMEREIPEEFFPAYNAGYRIGYRQAKRDLSELIERDKPRKIIEYTPCTDECPTCGGTMDNDEYYEFCKHCGQRLYWSE